MTDRDPYRVKVRWKPGARDALRARVAELNAMESVKMVPAFMPPCSTRGCREAARFNVNGLDYCWSHAKRAAGWKEEAQDAARAWNSLHPPADAGVKRRCRAGHTYVTTKGDPGRCWCGEAAAVEVVRGDG